MANWFRLPSGAAVKGLSVYVDPAVSSKLLEFRSDFNKVVDASEALIPLLEQGGQQDLVEIINKMSAQQEYVNALIDNMLRAIADGRFTAAEAFDFIQALIGGAA